MSKDKNEKEVYARLSLVGIGEGHFRYRGDNEYELSREDFQKLEERLAAVLFELGHEKLNG